ncbi:uncharacterized protein FIBRA_06263 [Fibroporia radiculosa]|uniref:Uncharacterized protein n=1 Tax=Fibroporia radiculosa TaxID=599839 RepID=J4GAY4_9APHY|nr:uncharacterized protein FIBRA_06263 [Fibroporia radiculosa]CCM04103.1 predicted protein [Fibroporia radiculosa]
MQLRARHIAHYGTRNTPLGKLSLPSELLSLICENIDNLLDAISFGLTNSILFCIAEKRISKLQCDETASWVGGRIICLGDYMEDDDLPEGMMTKVELEAIHKRAELSGFGTDDVSTLHDIACNTFRNRSWRKSLCGDFHKYSCRLSRDERKEFWRLYDPIHEIEGEIHLWVLCNLSKREFVRADATARLTKAESQGPFIQSHINFGTVLVSRICWSSDNSTALSYGGPIHRGAWAGDRFVITTLDRLEASSSFKDITNEALKVLTDIWSQDYAE